MILLFIEKEPRPGGYNMALDEVLAHEVEAGRLEAVIRLYGWRPPAVSLGKNQSAAEVDFAACRRDGIHVVRRPTGGRAVYHREELTYSLAAGCRHPLLGGSVMESYRTIGRGLCRGLRLLGLPAELVRAHSQGRAPAHPSCFAASGRYEISIWGRKVVGSAQRRYANSFLQQGSILLSQRQDVPYLRRPAPGDSFTTAARELGRELSWEQAMAAVVSGLSQEWGLKLSSWEPGNDIIQRARAAASNYVLDENFC